MRIVLLALSFISLTGFSQLDPYFASDGFTSFWNNPASTGSFNQFSLSTAYQNMPFTGISPHQTFGFTMEKATDFGIKSLNQEFGVGLNIILQQNGPLMLQTINLPISYSIPVSKHSFLSVGASFGMKRFNYDWSNIEPDIDHISMGSGSDLNLNSGLLWYSEKHYLGLSVTNIKPLLSGEVYSYSERRQYNLQSGYRFNLGKHYIYPMVNYTLYPGIYPLRFTRIITHFQFREDLFSVGAGFTTNEDFLVALTGNIGHFKLAYVNRFANENLFSFKSFAHEFRLTYAIRKYD